MFDLKSELLALLCTDHDIRNALRTVLNDEEQPEAPAPGTDTTELEQRCQRAESALEEAQETIFAQEQRLSALRQQCGRLQEVLAPYARLETVYGQYLELPESVRDVCGAFLNEFSPLSFAITGADETTLVRLHELICARGTYLEEAALRTLSDCFDLFFDLYLVGHPDFRRILTHEGDLFDPALHLPTPDSQPEGRVISKVLIAGFCDDLTGSFRKSYVRIGEKQAP